MRRMITTKQQELVEQLNKLISIIDIDGKKQLHFLGEKLVAQANEIDLHGTDSVSIFGVTDEYGEPKYYFDINEEDGVAITYYDSENDELFKAMQFTPETGMTLSGINGNIIMQDLPSADPHVAGALWNDNGTLKISAGA